MTVGLVSGGKIFEHSLLKEAMIYQSSWPLTIYTAGLGGELLGPAARCLALR